MVCSKDHAHIIEKRFKEKTVFQARKVLFTLCEQNSDCWVPPTRKNQTAQKKSELTAEVILI